MKISYRYTKSSKPTASQAGAAMAEFAMVLPILLFLILSFVDICGWLHTHIALNRATYEAARYAAIIPEFSYSNYDKTQVGNRFGMVVEKINEDRYALQDATILWDEASGSENNARLLVDRSEETVDRSIVIQARCSYEPIFLTFMGFLEEAQARVQIPVLT